MAKTLYLECYSGISGDMTVGALLDLGADQRLLEEQLRSLPVSGFEIEISRVKKSGLDACDFRVILDKEHENHDHDNEYLYGHGHKHEHHHHHAHTHDHIHRGLPEIREIILHSGITERAKKTALAIFQVLAEAEAKAHGTSIDEVHFHEVGAVDSIVDIVAAAVCLDNLAVDEVIVPELYEGRGTVRCQHGIIPVPVPAVVHIAGDHGITLHMTDTEAELVTPTGAAIVAAVRTADRLPKRYKILRTGMGAGKRDYGRASILRGMLIEPDTEEAADFVYKLESNIDDCTGEALGYVMDRLFEAGARDVNYIPVYMKKNRPAYQLNVLCSEETVPRIEEIIFKETTTIGIRRVRMERTVMRREIRTLATSLGEAKVKVCRLGCSDIIRVYPEYESAADISREKKLPYQDVWRQLQKEACEQIEKCYE
ncbi:MAG: nickel pincer cofactor biosynthesis protein LarC [Dorea sp.]|nr:nickel pincer cofactor biosynthesis protein LarC [Dorea sp.]